MGCSVSLQSSYVASQTPSTLECDLIWKQPLKQWWGKMRPQCWLKDRKFGPSKRAGMGRCEDCVRTWETGTICNQVERPQEKPDLQAPWFWTLSFQNCEEVTCGFSCTVAVLQWVRTALANTAAFAEPSCSVKDIRWSNGPWKPSSSSLSFMYLCKAALSSYTSTPSHILLPLLGGRYRDTDEHPAVISIKISILISKKVSMERYNLHKQHSWGTSIILESDKNPKGPETKVCVSSSISQTSVNRIWWWQWHSFYWLHNSLTRLIGT